MSCIEPKNWSNLERSRPLLKVFLHFKRRFKVYFGEIDTTLRGHDSRFGTRYKNALRTPPKVTLVQSGNGLLPAYVLTPAGEHADDDENDDDDDDTSSSSSSSSSSSFSSSLKSAFSHGSF